MAAVVICCLPGVIVGAAAECASGKMPTRGSGMTRRDRFMVGLAAGVTAGWLALGAAGAQDTALQPIPAADCQKFASQIQDAAGFSMKTGEDDFTDLTDGSEGRSCHISGSASGQAYASAGDLIDRIAKVFGDWRDEPARASGGADGAEKGLSNGNRIATIEVSWEPGPGVTCSDKQPLSACKILPQQKLWNAVVDIVVKGGK